MNATAHPATPEELMSFLDGELSSADSHTLAEHLEHCAECAAVADQFRATSRDLAAWSVPATAVHLDQALIERAARTPAPHGNRARWKPWAFGGGALASAALLFAIASPSAPPLNTRRQTGPPAQAEPVNTAPIGGVMGGSGGSAPPQVAGVAGMSSPMMLKEEGAPPVSMAMKRRAIAPPGQITSSTQTAGPAAPMIARTVGLTLRVENISTARAALDRIVAQHQGYAAELTLNDAESGFPTLQASLRIPAPELAAAVTELKIPGLVENETQTGEEVSEQHRDLLARLQNSRATEERFRAILQRHTGTVSDILEVEQAIATVRGEIEGMEAEQQALEHRVTFATVNLRLVSRTSARPIAPGFSSRLRDAFAAGYRNAAESLFGVALFFAEYGLTLVLWLVLLGAPILLLRLRYRRIHPRL